MGTRYAASILLAAGLAVAPATAQTTFFARPNDVPLRFGMDADEVARALGVPLYYVWGRPGDELLVALPNVRGSALSSRSDGLYLQFRRRHLTGWKGDWGTIRP